MPSVFQKTRTPVRQIAVRGAKKQVFLYLQAENRRIRNNRFSRPRPGPLPALRQKQYRGAGCYFTRGFSELLPEQRQPSPPPQPLQPAQPPRLFHRWRTAKPTATASSANTTIVPMFTKIRPFLTHTPALIRDGVPDSRPSLPEGSGRNRRNRNRATTPKPKNVPTVKPPPAKKLPS